MVVLKADCLVVLSLAPAVMEDAAVLFGRAAKGHHICCNDNNGGFNPIY